MNSLLAFVAVAVLGAAHARELSGLQSSLGHTLDARATTYSRNVSTCPGYTLSSVKETASSLSATLSLAGAACNAFGQDIKNLTIDVSYESSTRLHVNIYDTAKTQFTVPTNIITPPGTQKGSTKVKSDLVFNYASSPFAFWITRRSDPSGVPLFDTRIASLPKTPLAPVIPTDNSTALDGFPLVFEDSYLQLTSALPRGANVYGLGEVVASSGIRRDVGVSGPGSVQTNWARDVADPIDQNEYGIHPFYLEHRYNNATQTSMSHGVFLSSAAGADILLLSPAGAASSLVEYRMLGGTLDLYFFSGPTSQSVVEQYSSVAGTPTWQPLWGFGFHLCRWGYASVNETRQAVQRMRAANIPLETQWNDIDLYQAYRDFTTDIINFPGDEVRAFIAELHAAGQHYIPIVDAAVAKVINNGTDVYDPYTSGSALNTFVRNPDGSEYVGQVWPGYTVFPDWFAPNTQSWWTEALRNWTAMGVTFDGIWLDMNEASSFCEGSCGSGMNVNLRNTSTPFLLPGTPGAEVTGYPECYNSTIHGPSGNITVNGKYTCDVASLASTGLSRRGLGAGAHPDINVNAPPYMIHTGNGALSAGTIAANATHHGGFLDFDTHNIFGTMEEITTNAALRTLLPGKRPFIIGRSTFAGVGKYTGHWLGDNFSQWNYLHYMIQGVLQFQMFQVPMVGADTCGFNGNTDEELCNRWMQVAAFTPFFRNHNTKGAISQEPYVWDSVAQASRVAIAERYRLLPYWYSLFANASLRGTPPVRPLFFEFPNEPELFGIDAQFLVGGSILVTPVLAPNATTVAGIFPGRGSVVWRDWYTGAVVNATAGANTTLAAPLGHLNVHVRDSSVLLLHAAPAYTVAETAAGPYALLASLAADGYAQGQAFVDDGASDPPGPSTTINFLARNGSLALTPNGKFHIAQKLANVTVLGVASQPKKVAVSGTAANFQYDAATEKLVVSGLAVDLNSKSTLTWA